MACALDAIWRIHKPRSWMKSLVVYVVTVILGPLSMGAISVLWAIVKHWPYMSSFQHMPWLVSLADTMLPYLIIGLLLAIFNKVLPSGKVPWFAAMISSACTVLFFIVVKWFFVAMIVRGPTYSILYGNLSLFPLMMLWIYMMWVMVLLGALIVYSNTLMSLKQGG